ncbi:MAG: aminotransferase class IV [Bacteroidota bacterium]|nr:aminotransferase class IV [Bacteroidota bacterium]
MAKWAFLHNEYIEEENARIHFKDLSFQRGYGIFDFFRLIGNNPLFLNDHLDRFYSSAEGMRLPVPLEREAIKSAIANLIQKNNLPNTGIRISLTGGTSDDGFNIGQPSLLISQHTFAPPSEEQIQNGVRLLSYNYQRMLPHIKSIDYLMAVWLQTERIKAGADDILYVKDGWVSECPRSNFFLITEGNRLVTPAEMHWLVLPVKKCCKSRKSILVLRKDLSPQWNLVQRRKLLSPAPPNNFYP